MINFGAPNWFWALFLIPLLILLFIRAERRAAERLRAFVSARLLPNLARTVDRGRRKFRFALTLLGLALAISALAKPRWGYTYLDVKRKGLDLIFAADTSRSMLSNDVAPSRLQRVKLAAQDLLGELQGDRVGLVAFAGRAFLQAPLTIDYDAAVEAINDLDTNTIPEGGTNISAAIDLAVQTYGKSAIGNRSLIIFTDGEELNGDAVKSAKAAADAGVRIFTVGVGTPEGSLIPITAEGGGTGFVKDDSGQVVKSKLDEKRLKEIAETTGGFYIHLEGGTRSMKQLFDDGLAKMQSGEIDERLSRQPIERYQWPLGAALLIFSMAFLLRERKRERARLLTVPAKPALATAAIVLLFAVSGFAAAPGLDAYRNDNYAEAYQQFEKTLKDHPNTHATDKIEFDAGTAAYKLGDYNKALEWFSRSLLSPDKTLQEKSHYNIGRTLEERADKAATNEKALGELNNAQSHYEEAIKLDPSDERAKANLEEVKKKIERLKQKPKPSPTPPKQPPPQQDKKKNQNDQQQQNQQNQQDQQQQKNNQDQQNQQQQSSGKDQQQQQQAKNDKQQQQPNKSPSPSPGEQQQQNQSGSSPSPSPDKGNGADNKENKQQPENGEQDASPSASPSPSDERSPSPSPGSGEGQQPEGSPSASPGSSPGKPLTGKVEGANEDKPKEPPKNAEAAEVEPEKEGQMSEKQAQALLQSMKDEEQRVQLDERKVARHVYKDW
ncbi:MAG TPA: VWA domain-containing protein [Chthoniobacterales bacterium]|nr:VWA domain-containing protein [Chthoniobacterales bacterium]